MCDQPVPAEADACCLHVLIGQNMLFGMTLHPVPTSKVLLRNQHQLLLHCRPEVCYRAPWIAAPAVTHAGLTQVLNQLNHLVQPDTT